MGKKKNVFEYEVNWAGKPMDANSWFKADELIKFHKIYEKALRLIDAKIAAREAMFAHPLILILDEPTNYLDRDSLGALADAIDHYEGGIIMITHNDAFCSQLCPERWVLEAGRLNTE